MIRYLCKSSRSAQEKAEGVLGKFVLLFGYPAKLKLGFSRANLFIKRNDLSRAYEEWQALSGYAVLPVEIAELDLLRLRILLKSGNVAFFKIGFDSVRIQGVGRLDLLVCYRVLQAEKLRIEGDVTAAIQVLEAVLHEKKFSRFHAQVSSELGRFAQMTGNKTQAEHYFQKALDLSEGKDQSLHLLLIHNVVSNHSVVGRFDRARELLIEQDKKIQILDLDGYVDYTNTKLMFARQAADRVFLLQTYAVADLKIRPVLSRAEWLIYSVMELRMRVNDLIGIEEHVVKLNLVVDELHKLQFPQKYFAFEEIYYSLRSLLGICPQPGFVGEMFVQSIAVMKSCLPEIKKFRHSVNEALLSEHLCWIAAEVQVLKLDIKQGSDVDARFLKDLFGLLEDAVCVAERGGSQSLLLHHLIGICDEFVSYREFAPDLLMAEFDLLAKRTLKKIIAIVEGAIFGSRAYAFSFSGELIYVAWFEYQINSNKSASAKFLSLFDDSGFSIWQYALHLREKYSQVLCWLGDAVELS